MLDLLARRTDEVVGAVSTLDDGRLLAPSALPGWSRLTIVCHLRYGAEALVRMTGDVRAGQPTAFYPEGRRAQRPGTLVPRPGATPRDVVDGFAEACDSLGAAWAALGSAQWDEVVLEPAGAADLGPLPLRQLALSRLTEVEVHGTDLDLGLADWSDGFVAMALPFRLELGGDEALARNFSRAFPGP